MKRKDIKEAIKAAEANGVPVRDSAVFYLNTLRFVLEQSDTERCDYYDRIVLYIMYGIEPDFDTFSSRKKSNFSYIFSLLKTQRKGYINATKSNRYKNLPQGQNTELPRTKLISNKDNKLISNKDDKLISNKDDGSNKGASVEETQTTITIDDVDFDKLVDDFNQETKGAFGMLVKPLSEERKRKILFLMNKYDGRNIDDNGNVINGKQIFRDAYRKASKSSYLKNRNMSFDWMIEPTNFEKILSGNYDNRKSMTVPDINKLFDDD